jgi:hypothetical protein
MSIMETGSRTEIFDFCTQVQGRARSVQAHSRRFDLLHDYRSSPETGHRQIAPSCPRGICSEVMRVPSALLLDSAEPGRAAFLALTNDARGRLEDHARRHPWFTAVYGLGPSVRPGAAQTGIWGHQTMRRLSRVGA